MSAPADSSTLDAYQVEILADFTIPDVVSTIARMVFSTGI